MYAYPVFLPAFSNREDFLLTVSLFDDDTGDAINLSGITLANPSVPFTAADWTVTDGGILTVTTTSITIPNYPIGDQLSALAVTVETGLGILAGDPIKFVDVGTGLNTLLGYVTSYAPLTGSLVCQIGLTFQFEIRTDGWYNDRYVDDYSPFFNNGIGSQAGSSPLLSASLGNGITIIDQGFIQLMIPEVSMRQLRNRTYLASLTMTDSVNTRQAFIGKLPAQYGGVTN